MGQRALYEGQAIGGPLDGQIVNSRYPDGLIVVSRTRMLSGIYKRTEDKTYVYQEDDSYVKDVEKLEKMAEGNNYDIRSL